MNERPGLAVGFLHTKLDRFTKFVKYLIVLCLFGGLFHSSMFLTDNNQLYKIIFTYIKLKENCY